MIWKFPDNINTDFICPGTRTLAVSLTSNAQDLAKVAFIDYRPEFPEKVQKGDMIVAGENFGCGSSRESAAVALKACGLRAILAKSFARIFYRNAINLGLPLIVVDTTNFDEGDEVEIDFKNNKVRNKTKNFELDFKLDGLTKRILDEGGIVSYLQKNGLDSLEGLLQ